MLFCLHFRVFRREDTKELPNGHVLSSIWALPVSERRNAAHLVLHSTAVPFLYCRYYFKCFYCTQRYNDIRALLQHTTTHELPDEEKFLKELLPKGRKTLKVDISELKCRICNHEFTDLDSTRAHLQEEHSLQFTESGNGIVAYDLSVVDGQFGCHICGKRFQTFILLNRHMNVHFSNAVCETCGASFMTFQRLLKHKETHKRGGYPCTVCEKVYTTHCNLRDHVEKIHRAKALLKQRCPQCPARFKEHYSKLKHLREVHGVTYTLHCENCSSTFPSQRALTKHINKQHSDKTRCEFCDKRYSCPSVLRQHLFTHTDRRDHVCGVCEKTYRHNSSLRKHVKIQHGDRKPKFDCSQCNNTFSTKILLNKHRKEWHAKVLIDYCDE